MCSVATWEVILIQWAKDFCLALWLVCHVASNKQIVRLFKHFTDLYALGTNAQTKLILSNLGIW